MQRGKCPGVDKGGGVSDDRLLVAEGGDQDGFDVGPLVDRCIRYGEQEGATAKECVQGGEEGFAPLAFLAFECQAAIGEGVPILVEQTLGFAAEQNAGLFVAGK